MSSRQSVQNVSSSVPILGEQLQNLDLIGPKREADEAAQPPHAKRSKKMDLFKAIQKHDLESVKQALANGADVNAKFQSSRSGETITLLMYVAMKGYTQSCELLLEKGADIHFCNQYHWTAFLYAADRGHTEILKLLLEKGEDVNYQNNQGCTALMKVALYRGHLRTCQFLIDYDADVNLIDYKRRTALMFAAESGYTEIVQLLLKRGARVNAQDIFGSTAFWYSRNSYMMRLLLKNGGFIRDIHHVLMEAVMKGRRTDIIESLIDLGADVNHKDENGSTALMHAANDGHTDIVKVLIEHGADVILMDQDGETALMWAAGLGRTECVKILLDKGADVNHKNKNGDTALTTAARNGYIECVRLLIQHGALVQQRDVDTVNKHFEEALFYFKNYPDDAFHQKLVQNLPEIKTLLEERFEEQKELLRSAGRKVIKKHGLLPGELGNRISEYIASEYHTVG